MPNALPGWKAAEATAIGAVAFGGASSARCGYTNDKGDTAEVQITGNSAMIVQFATLLNNPGIAGAMGKIVRVGNQRAIQTSEGDINMVVANKFLVKSQAPATPPRKWPTRRPSTSRNCRRCS